MYTAEELIEFENEIADCFNDAQIKAPVHLYNKNEEQIIKIFEKHNIGPDDWVMCSWRSHYQWRTQRCIERSNLKRTIDIFVL